MDWQETMDKSSQTNSAGSELVSSTSFTALDENNRVVASLRVVTEPPARRSFLEAVHYDVPRSVGGAT